MLMANPWTIRQAGDSLAADLTALTAKKRHPSESGPLGEVASSATAVVAVRHSVVDSVRLLAEAASDELFVKHRYRLRLSIATRSAFRLQVASVAPCWIVRRWCHVGMSECHS